MRLISFLRLVTIALLIQIAIARDCNFISLNLVQVTTLSVPVSQIIGTDNYFLVLANSGSNSSQTLQQFQISLSGSNANFPQTTAYTANINEQICTLGKNTLNDTLYLTTENPSLSRSPLNIYYYSAAAGTKTIVTLFNDSAPVELLYDPVSMSFNSNRSKDSLVNTNTNAGRAELLTSGAGYISYVFADRSGKIFTANNNKKLVIPEIIGDNYNTSVLFRVQKINGNIGIVFPILTNLRQQAIQSLLNISFGKNAGDNGRFGILVVLIFDSNSNLLYNAIVCTNCDASAIAFEERIANGSFLITGTQYTLDSSSNIIGYNAYYCKVNVVDATQNLFTILDINYGLNYNSRGFDIAENGGLCRQDNVNNTCNIVTGVSGVQLDNTGKITTEGSAFAMVLSTAYSDIVRDLAFAPFHGTHIQNTQVATSEFANDVAMILVTELTSPTQTVYIYWSHVNSNVCSFPITIVVLFVSSGVVLFAFIIGYFFCKFFRNQPTKFKKMRG